MDKSQYQCDKNHSEHREQFQMLIAVFQAAQSDKLRIATFPEMRLYSTEVLPSAEQFVIFSYRFPIYCNSFKYSINI